MLIGRNAERAYMVRERFVTEYLKSQ